MSLYVTDTLSSDWEETDGEIRFSTEDGLQSIVAYAVEDYVGPMPPPHHRGLDPSEYVYSVYTKGHRLRGLCSFYIYMEGPTIAYHGAPGEDLTYDRF